MLRPAAFLDRDGVVNAAIVRDGRPHPPARLADLQILPGVEEACQRLRDAGMLVIVVTNQPDIARGTAGPLEVGAMNEVLLECLAIDAIFMCPHDDSDACHCRKPRPGLIQDAADEWGVDLSISTLVGDRWRDIEAGRAAGVSTVFLDRGYSERRPDSYCHLAPELLDAVPFILRHAERGVPVP